jgi:hypothetical protein
MLKKSASSVLNIREASFVPDSDVSRFTNDEDGLFEHPAGVFSLGTQGRTIDRLRASIVFL